MENLQNLPPFGRSMRQQFLIHPKNPALNHGAYGTYPKHVQSALHQLQANAESNADLWFHRQLIGELTKVRSELAQLVQAPDVEDLVFVPNSTTGINSILRSMIFKFESGDRILHFSTIYPSIERLVRFLSDSSQGTAHHVTPLAFSVTYPKTNEEFLKEFETFLDHQNNGRIKIALIDHISSSPGIVLPIQKIVGMLKKRNILVLIDGAHAIGHLPINLVQLGADFYVTNCHKWLYSARGSAILFVDKRHQDWVHPTNIGLDYTSQFTEERFQAEFFWNGTNDYSSYLSVTAALEFRRAVGGEEAIQNFTHSLAMEGGNYVAGRLGTRLLQEEEDQIGNMVDVQLPLINPDDPMVTEEFWQDSLLFRFNVYASTCQHGGKWWARLSAQIYNDLQDFEVVADALLKICQEVNNETGESAVCTSEFKKL